ncbi:TPA: hypothetical protein DIU27_00770 [Candidatus Collierbacteria bacterium]|uniref:Glycosyltransferase RgtA/B/C/D-like domain-containing protein n=1 Tax=Candidatus Collierbacteria bacterium GW2011_GWB2_44_22 TaxID=1618387 RepID=A0A0G1I0W6_9BACT|nr:MAG: hypothetical protein UW31_C0005G0015 [Candidatus Collierbacteria bacterium GW2011_GWA2_44_13]KKT49986.1 MAG: hypothetical protein UW42_C0027G0005 [Candidatus Collierbacteria bacterium GW2011_GWB1_44_197]KKT52463.1 MAG: hypothetical protein UW44_C0001G0015 [Candidatus Collierbacteria bacterium GW2011_GWB2_44_22]KKT61726.1 MAG: hypothetical protein UW56_C0020G0015 [Candidatus Collierbacteria bacterium GW2011_GWD1_44_27]KKT65533.1 MAG: hypothetical protein UW58_C0027G0015 [Candidatus Colli
MKINKYLPTILFTSVLLIGAFFRFYKLGETPTGLYVDEASLGYNAYSVYKTGMDEYGKNFPVMFRSFSTFQSSIYSYILIPFIHFLDLSIFSVRLPSAVFGFLSIPLLYLLVKKLFPSLRTNNHEPIANNFALITTLLLAISPWHTNYSRTAYETNVALFFLLMGSLFLVHALKKPWLFLLSALSFVISMMAYRAEIIIVPILILVFAIRYSGTLFSNSKRYLLPIFTSLALAMVLFLPTLKIMETPGFQARSSALNIFASSGPHPWGYREGTGLLHNLTNNPQILAAREFISLYSSYLSPRYMFSLGDSGPRLPYPGMGTFFVWQFPLYLIGLYFLIKEKDLKDFKYFVFTLLLISPVPAALTRDPYSTLRSLPLVISQILIISFGLVKLWEILPSLSSKLKYLLVAVLLIFSSVRMFISIFYFNDYFNSKFWNYGWELVVEDIKKLDPKLPVVVDSSRGDSYILMMFFLRYDPTTYQQDNFEVSPAEYYTSLNRSEIKKLGNITVKSIVWGPDTDEVEQYLVADYLAMSEVQIEDHNLTIIKEIPFPDGKVALRILKTNPKSK